MAIGLAFSSACCRLAHASKNTELYSNDKFNIAFEHAADMRIDFSIRSERSGVISAIGDPNAMINLTINGPQVSLSPMQKVDSDENVIINGIAMRKRLITDPAVGNPPLTRIEVIYDFTHNGNTFTWWGIFRKADAANQERMERIIQSFKFTQ